MLPASRQRLMEEIPDDARLLDVGGWAKPFARADAVIDIMPFASRGLYGYDGDRADERFTAETWTLQDLCGSAPWPYDDDAFDFVVCSHTLEDVRDPVRICEELVRVGRAGYVEVPSRLEEQLWGVHGEYAGWPHHHWLCDVDPAEPRIDFLFKNAVVHTPGFHLPRAFSGRLDAASRVECFEWNESFAFAERIMLDRDELLAALRSPVESEMATIPSLRPTARRVAGRARRRLAAAVAGDPRR